MVENQWTCPLRQNTVYTVYTHCTLTVWKRAVWTSCSTSSFKFIRGKKINGFEVKWGEKMMTETIHFRLFNKRGRKKRWADSYPENTGSRTYAKMRTNKSDS